MKIELVYINACTAVYVSYTVYCKHYKIQLAIANINIWSYWVKVGKS